jgi:hypothetical protein
MAVLRYVAMAARKRKRAPPELQEVDESRELRHSGVRRAAKALPESGPRLAHHASQRPTVPAPKCAVIEEAGSGVAELYTRIIDGTLGAANGEAFARAAPAKRLRPPPAITRDLFIALGSLERVPRRTCSVLEVRKAAIDPRHAFVLDLVDGQTPIESVIDASPMPMHEVLLTLAELLSAGLISLG